MQSSFRRTLLAATAVATLVAGSMAQAQQAAAGKKNWKDQAEYDLANAQIKEADPNKKLSILNSWKEKYPESEFKLERLQYFLGTYQLLQQPAKMVETAREILTLDPKDLQALYWITSLVPNLNNSTPDFLGVAEKAASGLLGAEKPAATPQAEWDKGKRDMEGMAHKTLGWVAMQRKDNEKAEGAFRKSLEVNPNAGEVSYWLGTVILAQRKAERQPEALYHFARAAAYEGPGALTPQGRAQIDAYLTKAYTTYHGQDDAGLKALKQQAKGQPFPAADFKIKSSAEIEVERENELRQSNPQLALWKQIRGQLEQGGEQYFEGQMKDAAVPELKGRLISHRPAARPTELVLGIADPNQPEVTLKLDAPLAGKAEPGTEISFTGVPKGFSKDPFMVTFEVEKEKLSGWPAQSAPPARRPPAKKTTSRKKA
ncbi:MAG: hypothetical protein FJW37_07330 [Acidobacteria bacterium]|nr:hypothetical protein [Acidobacteriota bacterium]